MNYEPFLTGPVKAAILGHMVELGTEEACGLITLSNGEYEYVPKINISEDKENTFRFDDDTQRLIHLDQSVVAYVHTHPAGPTSPSISDMDVQLAVQKPSVIGARDPRSGAVVVFSFGDHLLDYPLVGRPWRHGVMDCYEAIRAWKWQNENRKLMQFPREDEWWLLPPTADEDKVVNPNMYTTYFEKAGFIEFEPDFRNVKSEFHPRVGDGVLMQLGAPVINHAGIYVGDNLVYHHRYNKQSGNTPLGYLLDSHYVRKWVRQEPVA